MSKRAKEQKYVLVNCHLFIWVKGKEPETMPLISYLRRVKTLLRHHIK